MSDYIIPSPLLIYGTAWKKEKTSELVEKAILLGFRGIDTACQPKHYNEAGVGHALKQLKEKGIPRESIFIQTKFTPLAGQDPSRIPYNPTSSLAQQVEESFQTSLANLEIDYVDSLLLHSPLPQHEQTMEVWRAMETLQQAGSTHKIGLSNCYQLKALELIFDEAKVKPNFLQNRFYEESDYDKKLRKWCSEKKIIYQSFWSLTANLHILTHILLRNIAFSREITVEQLFFRFLTQLQIIPLIGTCSEKHMLEDLAIFEFTLTDDEINQINALLTSKQDKNLASDCFF